MLIDEKRLLHWIDNFYGYGSWHARFWFIGHEEGGGDVPEEVADKVNYFQQAHPESNRELADIRELYKEVAFRWEGPKAGAFNNMHEYRFDKNAVQHNVWKNLAAFAYGYNGKTVPNTIAFQQKQFLSSTTKNEALIQLYPLPGPHNHGWYYAWLDMPNLPWLKTRARYEEHVFPQRIRTILSNINSHTPEVVLMYGMDNINSLKNSIEEFFPGVKFKMIKAIKQQIPQHHRADIGGTTLLITTQIPALRHGRIETGFDWENFGRSVKVAN
jgi:hypothetical protein